MHQLLEHNFLRFDEYWEVTKETSDFQAIQFLHSKYDELISKLGDQRYNPLERLVTFRRVGYQRIIGVSREGYNSEVYQKLVVNVSSKTLQYLAEGITKQLIPHTAMVKNGEILIDVPLKSRLASAQKLSNCSGCFCCLRQEGAAIEGAAEIFEDWEAVFAEG